MTDEQAFRAVVSREIGALVARLHLAGPEWDVEKELVAMTGLAIATGRAGEMIGLCAGLDFGVVATPEVRREAWMTMMAQLRPRCSVCGADATVIAGGVDLCEVHYGERRR
jgi:hypothetical protein